MDLDLSSTHWIKSRHSGNGGNCIEVAPNFPGLVPVRDSKNPTGPALAFPTTSFAAFLARIKDGEFDTV
ncbi:DUF397 domain-containing protein [Kitasatospora sp. NBC_01250]|uniref:DUF397 domain-containing protein n=1 Tax=Kitasatospora sp. NBC_01250 TaxID=2903571 RepID=UPI002E358F7D|nr:DUF397 domain-containing protein [Kitasatospora sp. NBC_01250]